MKKFNKTPVPLALALVAGWPLTSVPVSAETATLEEVIVIARKRTEVAQDVPISITAINEDLIVDNNISNLFDVQTITPNMSVTNDAYSGQSALIGIRGQRASDNLLTFQPAVGVYKDGAYRFTTQGLALDNMWDIAQIEVLKGPQGTLFGRNTTGGALVITSNEPTDEFGADMRLGVGNNSSYELSGTLNAPLSDTAALRLSGQFNSTDGYGKNLTNGENLGEREQYNVQAALKLNPTDRLQLLFRAEFVESEAISPPRNMVYADPTSVLAFAALLDGYGTSPADSVNALLDAVPEALDSALSLPNNDQDFEGQWYTLSIDYDIGDNVWFRSITSYQDTEADMVQDADGSPSPILDAPRLGRDVDGITQEFNIGGTAFDDRLDWVVGAFYLDTEGNDFQEFVVVPVLLGGAASITDADVDNRSYAVFAQGTYAISDKLNVTAGVRWSKDEQDMTIRSIELGNCALVVEPGEPCEDSFDTDDDDTSYSLTVDYAVLEDSIVYARTARGYRGGGMNPSGAGGAIGVPFGPEQVTDYELGFKSQLLDNRLRFNVAGFYSDYEDIQRASVAQGPGGNVVSVVQNAASATIKGAELEVTAVATDNLTFSASGGWVDAELDEYMVGEEDRSDLGFAFPEYMYSLSGTHTLQTSFGEIRSVVTWAWRDDQDFMPENHANAESKAASTQEAYDLLSARIALQLNDKYQTEIALWGQNLTDEEYKANTLDVTDAGFGFVTAIYGPGRTYGAQLTMRF